HDGAAMALSGQISGVQPAHDPGRTHIYLVAPRAAHQVYLLSKALQKLLEHHTLGDPSLLRRMLLALLSNAMKAAGPGGKLGLRPTR
ncbi:hypothetical protein NE626_15945, partial [Intestinimonas massiliensis]|uniref:hypothetical protein n=1 Tax=Intestinimonas massiliensis (ex Afouda et al. 2020) TaxID=1673721 RepID=UPI00210D8D37